MNRIKFGDVIFQTSIAFSKEEQSVGLMHQTEHRILSFPFKDKAIRKFWMHETPNPLDVIFCSDGKIVSIAAGEPYSDNFFGPDVECDLVVEMPAGTCESKHIKVGDSAKLLYDLNSLKIKFSS